MWIGFSLSDAIFKKKKSLSQITIASDKYLLF